MNSTAAHERHAVAVRAPRRRDCRLVSAFTGWALRSVLRHALDGGKGQSTAREALLRKLVDIQYERAEEFAPRHVPRARDRIEIYPPYEDNAYAVELWGDQVDAIRQFDPVTGEIRSGQNDLPRLTIYPKSHYVMPAEQKERAIRSILEELTGGSPSSKSRGNTRRRSASGSAPCSTLR